jgi:hypothetical protein
MTRGTRADGGMGRIRGVRRPSWVWIRLGLAGAVGRVVGVPWFARELPCPLGRVTRGPERLWARVIPPRVAAADRLTGLTGPEQVAVAAPAQRLDGRLVWLSNRRGHDELYLIDLRTRSVPQLTYPASVKCPDSLRTASRLSSCAASERMSATAIRPPGTSA